MVSGLLYLPSKLFKEKNMLPMTLKEREKLVFSCFEKEIKDMLFKHNRSLKAVLIHGVSKKNRKKNAEAVSEIDTVKNFISKNMQFNLNKIDNLLGYFTDDERKEMGNKKKEYRVFVSKVMKNLKKVRYNLNVKLGS